MHSGQNRARPLAQNDNLEALMKQKDLSKMNKRALLAYANTLDMSILTYENELSILEARKAKVTKDLDL
ncbi:hypothetical protein NHP190012_10740 [Helicobacter sp. NHP19-012]|uniref:Uncharacterized protein n=1 Tax=Helicobacter gastrofelis TaxID=2849642 RepID=A0ABN6I8U7_9HELI|nr:hypothetical protein NHP190012_10740 [Helicobacter sp. NHP19-012]GMB96422.1 hypothetical protein NHP22001_10110 [Helicobacter sp. NHP22-001]